MHPHLSADMGQHLVTVVEFNAKCCTRKGFDDLAFHHDHIIFLLRQNFLLVGDGVGDRAKGAATVRPRSSVQTQLVLRPRSPKGRHGQRAMLAGAKPDTKPGLQVT